jgi:hypothetical protein
VVEGPRSVVEGLSSFDLRESGKAR